MGGREGQLYGYQLATQYLKGRQHLPLFPCVYKAGGYTDSMPLGSCDVFGLGQLFLSLRPYILDMLLLRQKPVQTRVDRSGKNINKIYSEMMPWLKATQLPLCPDLRAAIGQCS